MLWWLLNDNGQKLSQNFSHGLWVHGEKFWTHGATENTPHFKVRTFWETYKIWKKIFLMVLINQLIYLVKVKTMRKIFSNHVCFSKSPKYLGCYWCLAKTFMCVFWMNPPGSFIANRIGPWFGFKSRLGYGIFFSLFFVIFKAASAFNSYSDAGTRGGLSIWQLS